MDIESLKYECEQELQELLAWWTNFTPDELNGGFYGQIGNDNQVNPNAPKGLVYHARILFTFSAAHLYNRKIETLEVANSAYQYLTEVFLDKEHGGFYWSVYPNGTPREDRKQVYGQAFAIYALSEYYKINADENVLQLAKNTYMLLEAHSFDKQHTGYIEALDRNWGATNHLRLSAKDLNEKKSMNTHLHVIEAYANLCSVWPDEVLKKAIKQLLNNFTDHIIDSNTSHLRLFFAENWDVKSTAISFGHDIEAAWLLQEAAAQIEDKESLAYFKKLALKMAKATESGLADTGGLYYEFDPANPHWTKEFHWWVQAEAMVGFFNAYEVSGEQKFLMLAINVWNFIKTYIKNQKNGEWFWGVDDQYVIMQNEDKAGFWKCPYHNGRACLEILKRTSFLTT